VRLNATKSAVKPGFRENANVFGHLFLRLTACH